MKSSDELYLLIKSLSKQEKSYFKKFASAFADKKNSNYLRLFDEIVNQTTGDYKEERIKKKNFGGKFIKNFSFHKNYLYNMILNSLAMYNRDKSEEYSLRFILSQIKILFEKNLAEQSYKLLLKAKKIAREGNCFPELQSLYAIEKTIVKQIMNSSDFNEIFERVTTEQKEAFTKQINALDYATLYTRIGILSERSGTGHRRNPVDSALFEDIFRHELVQDESKALSFQGKYYLFNIRLQYFLSVNGYSRAHKEALKIVNLFEDDQSWLRKDLHKYIVALINLLTVQCRVSDFPEREETIRKLSDLSKKYNSLISDSDKSLIFYSTSVLSISSLFMNPDRALLKKHLEDVSMNLPKFEKKLSLQKRIIIYYFLGVGNFVIGNFEGSISSMGKIINGEKSDHSEDYQCHSRIVNLLSYYELKYFDSLEHVLKSAYRFLSKKNRVFKYENIILKYLRRSFRIKTKDELNEMLIEMRDELNEIYDDEYERNAFDAFNIIYWLESKIEKKPLIEVMKKKSLQSS